jgi:hypothetical protein
MHGLKKFIAESVKTYNYTIKVAGEVDKNWLDMFKYNLNKFDPIKISDPTTTPIQKTPYGFPGIENQPVTIMKCEFRYPATEPMIQQMAQLLGYNVNMVRVVSTSFDDSMNNEASMYQNQMDESPVLTHEQMPDNGKEAGKAYSNSYLDEIKKQTNDGHVKGTEHFDGAKTKDSFDPWKPMTDDKSLGDKSPMTTIKRPALPKTGAQK